MVDVRTTKKGVLKQLKQSLLFFSQMINTAVIYISSANVQYCSSYYAAY